MNHYQQLTKEQRYQIYGLRKAWFNQTETANEIGVNKSAVCRELRRNRGNEDGVPSRKRRQQVCNHAKGLDREAWNKVDGLIRQDMSPE